MRWRIANCVQVDNSCIYYLQYHCHVLLVTGRTGVHLMLQEPDSVSDTWKDQLLMVEKNVQISSNLAKVYICSNFSQNKRGNQCSFNSQHLLNVSVSNLHQGKQLQVKYIYVQLFFSSVRNSLGPVVCVFALWKI